MISPHDRDMQRLRELCEATAPADPAPEKLEDLCQRIAAGVRPARLVTAERRRALRRTAGTLIAVAAAVLLAIIFWPERAEVEIFPVATAAEVQIISVAGGDANALAVGEPPVRGTLELLAPGDVVVTNIQPADRDMMRPQQQDRSPMIWARLDTEVD